MPANTFNYSAAYGFSLLLLSSTAVYAAESSDSIDAHIRRVVESLLKEKDKKIQQLEARIEQLADASKPSPIKVEAASATATIATETTFATPKLIATNTHPSLVMRLGALGSAMAKLKQNAANNGVQMASFFKPSTNGQSSFVGTLDDLNNGIVQTQQATAKEPVANTPTHTADSSFLSKLGDLGTEVAELKQKISEKGLDISGFFDVNAETDNTTNQNFNIGSVELDLEYTYNQHFAASSALIMCGNSSGALFTAPAAIICGSSGPGGWLAGGTGFGVALVDYHLFDKSIPPRGRIFNNQGFHIQAGRFDIPFSSDYQNFANKDRITVTAPITTSRMELGGFNGDGLRSYGSWKTFNYSAFWTNSMYAEDGGTIGGRLGMSLGQNIYRVHNANPEGIEIGISNLRDLDKQRNLRHSIYSADLSIGYHFLRLQSEFMLLQSFESFVGANGINYGKPNAFGYHTTLIADLESFIDHPVSLFARFGRWQPHNRFANDFDGELVSINNVSALTLGFNYTLNEYLKFKLEYTDSLGTATQERYFDKKLGIAQMVMAF